MRRRPPDFETQIDREVGARVKALRLEQGISSVALARRIGVSFQQVQKYESAGNRISAGRLYDIAKALGVPVARLYGLEPAPVAVQTLDPELIALAREYIRIPRARRRAVLKMIAEITRER